MFASSSLVFAIAHLDVKGRLRSEISEGAGNHDSGALMTKHTHTPQSVTRYRKQSSTHVRAALLYAAGGGGGATGGGLRVQLSRR